MASGLSGGARSAGSAVSTTIGHAGRLYQVVATLAPLTGNEWVGDDLTTATEFAAFISYNRTADADLAQAVQHGLQRFTKPWYRVRALRVFRDDASLGANPGLWPALSTALERSRHFILLACPEAASSPWVAREIVQWLDHHPGSSIMIVLTGGEIVWDADADDFAWDRSTALPNVLRGHFRHEPRYVDLRWARQVERGLAMHPRFTEAVADLAVPLHDRPKDDLIGDDVRQHRRTARIARSVIAALTVLVLLAGTAGVVAVLQRDRAVAQERVAVSRQLAAQALVDLPSAPDRALLLGLESRKLHDGVRGRDAILRSLQRVDYARGYLDNDVPVYSAAYSPDGAMLATGHDDGSVRLWDVAQRSVLGEIPGHQLISEGIAFSPDGTVIAAVDRAGAVVVYDVSTRERRGPPFGERVRTFAFSPDGSLVATGDSLGFIRFWDVATGRPVGGAWEPADGILKGRVSRLDWSRSGTTLAVLTTSGKTTLRDLRTGEVVPVALPDPATQIRSIGFSPDGSTLALGTSDGPIVLWDVAGRRARDTQLRGHTAGVLSLAFNRKGTRLVSGSVDKTVLTWDTADGKQVGQPLRGHGDSVRAVTYRPDGVEIASGGIDGSLVLWQESSRLVAPITEDEHDLRSVAFSADLGRLVFGYGTGELYTWDLPGTARNGGPLRVDGHVPETLAISRDGALAASGDGNGRFVLWDLRQLRPIGEALRSPEPDRTLRSVFAVNRYTSSESPRPWNYEHLVFSPDGSRLATVSFNNKITMWDTGTGRPVGEMSVASRDPVMSLAFSPDGSRLASGGLSGHVALWNAATGEVIGGPLGHGGNAAVSALAFSPDGRLLAFGSDAALMLWDVTTGQPVTEPLRGQPASIERLAFSPTGAMLASADSVGSVVLWDVAARQPVGDALSWHYSPVRTLEFAPDGERLATGSSDGTAFWDLAPASWARSACEIANRDLTPTEWDQLFAGARPYERSCPR